MQDRRLPLLLGGLFAVAVLTACGSRARAADDADPAAGMKRYESRYYLIYTDLDIPTVKESIVRMDRMAEEYHNRTKDFVGGTIHSKFPFYLFKTMEEYHAAGGMEGTAGVFASDGKGGGKLMACAGQKITLNTWHTVQHEGFHQFVAAVIGGGVPPWVNEGLAEYFGESVFTGDGFVTGVIPPQRLARLKGEIANGEFKSLAAMMRVSGAEWNAEMNIQNYDQAWSMVHFLVYGDDGKYQQAFAACLRAVSAGKSFDRAWAGTIGSPDGFEARWKAYWTAQPDNPTAALYARARVATFTSFVARAAVAKQPFADFAAFHDAVAEDGTGTKMAADDWLPPALLATAFRGLKLDDPDVADRWQIAPGDRKQPTVCFTAKDGVRYVGWYTLRGNKVDQVNVEVDDLAKTIEDGKALLAAGKKEQAKAAVQAGLRAHPRSVAAADAQAFVKQCR